MQQLPAAPDIDALVSRMQQQAAADWARMYPVRSAVGRWGWRLFMAYWVTYFSTAMLVGYPYRSPMLDALAMPGAIMLVVGAALALFVLVWAVVRWH